jgi:hypothetical protein
MKTNLTIISLALTLAVICSVPWLWQILVYIPVAGVIGTLLVEFVPQGTDAFGGPPPLAICMLLAYVSAGLFMVTAVVAACLFADRERGLRAGSFLAATAYGYVITVVANAAYIVFSPRVAFWLQFDLIESFWRGAMVCGWLAAFVVALVLTHECVAWKRRHVHAV